MIDPTTSPRFATMDQINIIQMRDSELNKSSILRATTIVGIAERTPVMKRPTITAAKEGIAATTTQKIE